MKFMSETNTGSSNSNNWLGFSLSPHMKMEVVTSESQHHTTPQHHHHHHQIPVSDSVPTSYFLSPPTLNASGMCFGVGENGVFSSSLSVMPLKSDGSLCIMEALSRSQTEGMVASSTPKLENFLGGATMVGGSHHHYGGHEREVMPLSLDSMYYHQNADSETNKHHSLDLLPVQAHHNFYSDMATCHGFYDPSLDEEEEQRKQTQLEISHDHHIPHLGNGIPCFKTWAVSNQMNSTMVETNSSNTNNGGLNVGSEALSVGSMGGGDMQSLSLSMSPGSQSSSCVTASQISGTECVVAMETTKKRGLAKVGQIQNQIQKQPVHRKSIDTFGQRTSQYRGVTRHRWTGRYEAHLWDNSCKKEGQTRKGRQVYLGGYDMEEKAARAYDLAALKYWGPSTHINFPLENYQEQLEEMKNMSRQEYVAHLRRKSSGFSRGASMYRGVTRHHQHGRWQARIGRVAGNKDLYLGTFSTQEEAAEAYDIAAIKFRGVNAVTNFDITRYDVERIMASNTLLAGELARRNKEIEPNREATDRNMPNVNIQDHVQQQPESSDNGGALDWKMVMYQTPPQQQSNNSFSMALQDLIGTEPTNSSHGGMVDEASKMGNNQFSNPSSLVTSLSSSREDSPERGGVGGGNGSGIGVGKTPLGIPKFINPSVPINSVNSSWFPSPQLRANAITSMSHLPVFAAWNDT